MQIIFILIAISISLALFFLVSFLWATKSGQFEDTYGPAYRVLFDDEDEPESKNNQKQVECK
ncbi:MAG: cbb3-type cytochrome oxidase assembly protein CcoS [Crocinitomix sp.]|nr:cbb3-type cytochrome oxidase assembly protein CcoS [Crocinitomix sp.]